MQTDQKNVIISNGQKDPNAVSEVKDSLIKKVYSFVPI